jgi:hypothetical protein
MEEHMGEVVSEWFELTAELTAHQESASALVPCNALNERLSAQPHGCFEFAQTRLTCRRAAPVRLGAIPALSEHIRPANANRGRTC